MNTLQTDKIYGGPIAHKIDYFCLPVFEHFNGKPFHIYETDQKWNFAGILTELKGSIIRSRKTFDSSLTENKQEKVIEVLLQLDNAFCSFQKESLCCYADTPDIARKTARRLIKQYAEKPVEEEKTFGILSIEFDLLHIQMVKVAETVVLDEEGLQLHYGNDAIEFERYLTGAWDSGASGLTIFRGPPGTGKTSYIRHLISKLWKTHRFYYLPVNACRYLSSPDMVEFWLKINRIASEYRKIVVLEDAEGLLMERGADNQAKVAALLNICDGLMSDFLKLHLLCTVNCPMDKLDPAIIRPGRLTAVREFRRLDKNQAERIAKAKTIALPEQDDYSLAEIYRANQWRDDQKTKREIGFNA